MSLQLGIPTANIPADDLTQKFPNLETGVYYGVVALDPKQFVYENASTGETEKASGPVLLPAVLSIGYNPFYKNTVRSVVCPGSQAMSCPRKLVELLLTPVGNSYHAASHTTFSDCCHTA